MICSTFMRRIFRLGFVSLALAAAGAAVTAAERKMEARLIWGTNEKTSPDPKHRPLDRELAQKLQDMPLKWTNYFEVNRQVFTINDREYTNVVMSKQCSIQVKDKGTNNVTVKVIGQGKEVNRVNKPLPRGEVLTIGGDARNNSAWFITVRPVNVETRTLEQKKEPAIAKPAPAK